MQAQAQRLEQHQAEITVQQSTQSIQTLLRAGLGCITYLRNLLPSDNFSESYLTSSGSEPLSSQPSRSSSASSSFDGRQNVSGFKIMTVTRGFTEEADRLLDYLENGIFDALQKQYLRSFIFAIYLDNQDPNNIVEAYTFNFHYHKIPGTETVVPVMSLGEDMMNLSLSGNRQKTGPTPTAISQGKIPTLGEVKRSLKTLVKNLIQATTQMDSLPKRRFATFKLFYYENTPDDYEPAHFRAGDHTKDKWFMSTHNSDEVPDRYSIGSVQTGYHGVDVKIASISGYLPSGEDNNAPFLGTTNHHASTAPTLSPFEEAAARAQQIALQQQDAAARRVVWDGDDGLADDAGEEDGKKDGEGSRHIKNSVLNTVEPIGVRQVDGTIAPIPSEAHYSGREEAIPNCIGHLARAGMQPVESITQTQPLEDVPSFSRPSSRSPTPIPAAQPRGHADSHGEVEEQSPLPPSDIEPSPPSSANSFTTNTLEIQMVKDMITENVAASFEDSPMFDMETQQHRPPDTECADTPDVTDIPHPPPAQHSPEEVGLDCECGVEVEDFDICACDGGCGRWYHLWCMGYHSAQDPRIPSNFLCFDCRVKADRNWDLIVVHDLYASMVARFKALAIQRRGIKMFETVAPEGLAAFTKVMGCDSTVAGQVFKRLEAEGFIALETRDVDDAGILETVSARGRAIKKGKNNAKTAAANRRKLAQKPKYVFVRSIVSEDAYKDYFNPDPEVEKRLLNFSDLKPRRKAHHRGRENEKSADKTGDSSSAIQRAPSRTVDSSSAPVELPSPMDVESQTQAETQYPELAVEDDDMGLKRKASDQPEERAKKKIKISLAAPVDLGD